jgi:hypothetical protein
LDDEQTTFLAAPPAATDNGQMALLEAAVVLGLVGLIIYGTITLATRPRDAPRPIRTTGGHWRVAHYESAGSTLVVVQKVLDDEATVVDEHVVATIAQADVDYDEKFLEAMARARQRVALFESEED